MSSNDPENNDEREPELGPDDIIPGTFLTVRQAGYLKRAVTVMTVLLFVGFFALVVKILQTPLDERPEPAESVATAVGGQLPAQDGRVIRSAPAIDAAVVAQTTAALSAFASEKGIALNHLPLAPGTRLLDSVGNPDGSITLVLDGPAGVIAVRLAGETLAPTAVTRLGPLLTPSSEARRREGAAPTTVARGDAGGSDVAATKAAASAN